ncbi:MAG: glycosyltransferase [Candidatus Aminicenantes bacterium]|nr:glycosyltransferase [Candidatus Aminicenantes bacterium]
MKIAYVAPGSGGKFYCQNCFLDNDLIKSLRQIGHDAIKIPMYLPANMGEHEAAAASPVFFGAINVYLKEKLSFYRYFPGWLRRFFDSSMMLRLAAGKAGSTRAAGLEEMTVSMLLGENGRQAAELDQLIHYLVELKPDVVHLANALLLGLAGRIKKDVKAAIVCSLQDEDEWTDSMTAKYRRKIWEIMAEKAAAVDFFITSSRYYAGRSQKRLGIPAAKIKIIYGGLDLAGYEISSLPFQPPVIGYLCRMSEYFGLGILVGAFLILKKESRFKDLKLHITGGYTADDKRYVTGLLGKIKKSGWSADVRIDKYFDKEHRRRFLRSLTLLSVPVPQGESFGAYQVEALAAGVPVVQPAAGCFPEFVQVTQGGVIYEPNDSETLARTIASLLTDPAGVRELAAKGRKAVLERFSMKNMAAEVVKVYEAIINK